MKVSARIWHLKLLNSVVRGKTAGGAGCNHLLATVLLFIAGHFRGQTKPAQPLRSNMSFLAKGHLTFCSPTWGWNHWCPGDCCWFCLVTFCLTLAEWMGPIQVGFLSFDIPHHSLSISLSCGMTRCSRLIFHFPYPRLGIIYFLKKPWSCSAE